MCCERHCIKFFTEFSGDSESIQPRVSLNQILIFSKTHNFMPLIGLSEWRVNANRNSLKREEESYKKQRERERKQREREREKKTEREREKTERERERKQREREKTERERKLKEIEIMMGDSVVQLYVTFFFSYFFLTSLSSSLYISFLFKFNLRVFKKTFLFTRGDFIR